MASLNKVFIIGNLGQDPELRYTQNQVAVATLNIATTDFRMGQDGQRQENTEWHRVVVWNKQAENCSRYLTKGRSVMVEGRLQTRAWEDKSGQKRYTTEVVAQNVQFLGGKGEGRPQQQQGGQESYGSPPPAMGDNGGGQQNYGGNDSAASLDDIPF